MKRTISHEAEAAVSWLQERGFTPASVLPSRGGLHPLTVLGLGPDARWPGVRQAFVGRLRQYPPERHPEEFVQIVDAYDTLKRYFRNLAQLEDQVSTPSAPSAKRLRMSDPGVAQANIHEAAVAGAAPVGGGCVIALDCSGVAYVGGCGAQTVASGSGAAGSTTGGATSSGFVPTCNLIDEDEPGMLSRSTSCYGAAQATAAMGALRQAPLGVASAPSTTTFGVGLACGGGAGSVGSAFAPSQRGGGFGAPGMLVGSSYSAPAHGDAMCIG